MRLEHYTRREHKSVVEDRGALGRALSSVPMPREKWARKPALQVFRSIVWDELLEDRWDQVLGGGDVMWVKIGIRRCGGKK